jgi:pimeloyl-ACP methyl ester carboxylesterase
METAEPLLCLCAPGALGRTQALVAARRRLVIADRPAGLERSDLLAHGPHATAALRLALEQPQAVRTLVLLAPRTIGRDGAPGDGADAALLERLPGVAVPSLAVFGTRDASAPPEAARHYRERIPGCNLVFVYDAGAAMMEERPEAVASLVLDFLERHDLFLVRRESDLIFP